MTHWAAEYLGTPWVPGVSDCWSFARGVWAERFGWQVQAADIDPSDARAVRQALAGDRAGWVPVVEPQDGDAVLMAMGLRPCHVGIWVAADPAPGVLHSVERSGVIFTPPHRLHQLGYRIVDMYRRAA